jgi:hypothetical protein
LDLIYVPRGSKDTSEKEAYPLLKLILKVLCKLKALSPLKRIIATPLAFTRQRNKYSNRWFQ